MKMDGGRELKMKTTEKRLLLRYLAVSAFCLLFSAIYRHFSHGIHSPWMSYLAAWPLVLGAAPAAWRWQQNAKKASADRVEGPAGMCQGDSPSDTIGASDASRPSDACGSPVPCSPSGAQGGRPLDRRRSHVCQGVCSSGTSGAPGSSFRTDLYHFGVAALTVASLLKGILEIAGTDSGYPGLLLFAGAAMLAIGAAGAFRGTGQ